MMRISDGQQGREAIRNGVERAYRGYGAGEEMPLGGYAAIMGVFLAAVGLVVAAAQRQERRNAGGVTRRMIGRLRGGSLPARPELWEVALLGIATHKLTRIITKDWVTAPLRAPFTEYKESTGAGEVSEKSRGHGLQRAVGDLLTCQFCTGPWVAAMLTGGLVFVPRLTRFVGGALAMVTISDWLHILYERFRKG